MNLGEYIVLCYDRPPEGEEYSELGLITEIRKTRTKQQRLEYYRYKNLKVHKINCTYIDRISTALVYEGEDPSAHRLLTELIFTSKTKINESFIKFYNTGYMRMYILYPEEADRWGFPARLKQYTTLYNDPTQDNKDLTEVLNIKMDEIKTNLFQYTITIKH